MKPAVLIVVAMFTAAIIAAPLSTRCPELYNYCAHNITNGSQRIDKVNNLYEISDEILEKLTTIYDTSQDEPVSNCVHIHACRNSSLSYQIIAKCSSNRIARFPVRLKISYMLHQKIGMGRMIASIVS